MLKYPLAFFFMTLSLTLSFCVETAFAQNAADENDPKWECYAPAPGHPTDAERVAFVDKASKIAVDLEKSYGVPAPAITAMAAVESGYGWTRIAVFANNFFGWKGEEGAGSAYHLKCQPLDTDPNAFYVKFNSLEASMSAVAERLAKGRNYQKDTARYQADLKEGIDPALAARLWIDAIAPRYNGKPWLYRSTLKRVMNDPISPADFINPKLNLYRLAPPPVKGENRYAHIVDSIAYKTVIKLAKRDLAPGARTMDNCIDGGGSIQKDYPEYEGYPVKRCIYQITSPNVLKGLVYTLHPTAEQVAAWTAFACIRADASDQSACATRLFRTGSSETEGLYESNNAQFPVSGNVIEIGSAGGCTKATVNNNIFFRHGVTVKLKALPSVCSTQAFSISDQEQYSKSAVERYRFVARVSALKLQEYSDFTGKSPTGDEWARINQLSYLTGLDDGVNALLNIQAERLFGSKR
ncbi:glucosaminidase domain-containing protein (plasmid) [Rhizobium lusitanum]|uniref:glucosaminidase domain-containing protein n=1 Tax=Rhizobium lusitanum TaxID=293958 RepID=UPI00161696BE|nr:glucosaminidase domain-containing protein [Rhizobium lusitanum]QND44659.1 glucosaminidase domain-containing protein [Rhizobium lusitanum]